MRCFAVAVILLSLCPAYAASPVVFGSRFEEIKKTASPRELYAFLFDLPKGGDLHNHGGLSTIAETWFDLAVKDTRNRFYTLTKFNNCPGDSDTLPRYYTIQRATYDKLSPCLKGQYEAMNDLPPEKRAAWISAMHLDRPGEGRDEFFERIVTRFGDLGRDPYMAADALVENMRQFGREKVRYVETQILPGNYVDREGNPVPADEAARIYSDRLNSADAKSTGVTTRLQDVIIRFLPGAEKALEEAYAFVAAHRDLFVGINMAGREDNEKGYALRFLDTFRRMRRTYSGVGLSIHGGEVDLPGRQVHDTLLLGATRIGHGLNLITDPDTMLLMRDRRALVEINLVSNRVLEYFPDLTKHPFPEYLRTGIPVCLNTDDRGSWDSNMTDEYFTAVTTFNLSWSEVVQLGRSSLEWAFADDAVKRQMLRVYDEEVAVFEDQYGQGDWKARLKSVKPVSSGYAQRTWNLKF